MFETLKFTLEKSVAHQFSEWPASTYENGNDKTKGESVEENFFQFRCPYLILHLKFSELDQA